MPTSYISEITNLLEHVRQNLCRPWTIDKMAEYIAMNRRTFQRRFLDATGQRPGQWLFDERMKLAKDMLARTQLSMEDVAIAAGSGSAHSMRHHFRVEGAISPSEYRRQFSAVDKITLVASRE